jgi:hypothetical protein
MINTNEIVDIFIANPAPLWDVLSTDAVVKNKWFSLTEKFPDENLYSTAGNFHQPNIPTIQKIKIASYEGENIYLEYPSFEHLQKFYDEHGLHVYKNVELILNDAEKKIDGAFEILKLVEPAYFSIIKLVKSIQVLKQEDPETDTSYSHPDIPFSIFTSVCNDDSVLSRLRVAESILHEAMHLKLTLIENIIPLVKPLTGNVYFSPWRDELRPAQGILHGLFVFRAVYDLFLIIKNKFIQDYQTLEFLNYRLEKIESEITSLTQFFCNPDLTDKGKMLAIKLII